MTRLNRHPTPIDKEMVLDRELRAAIDAFTWPSDGPPRLVSALFHIKEHLFDPALTVGDLRRQCGLRNHNITTRFRRHFGYGLRAFIEHRRILTAKRLLRLQALEIWRISDALGFASQETFARAFKRQTGITATDYRRAVLRRAAGEPRGDGVEREDHLEPAHR